MDSDRPFLLYDGLTGYVSVPDDAVFDCGTDGWAAMVRFKSGEIRGSNLSHTLFSGNTLAGTFVGFLLDYFNLLASFATSSPSFSACDAQPLPFVAGEQVVLFIKTYYPTEITTKTDIYINGILVATRTNSGKAPFTMPTALWLGAQRRNPDNLPEYFFLGEMSQAAFFKGVPKTIPSDLSAINDTDFVDADDSPIDGWYSNFNGSGTTLQGRKVISGVGSALNGTLYGGVVWQNTPKLCTLDDVKSRLGMTTADNDVLFCRIIAGVEAVFNKHTMRTLVAPAFDVTEYYTGQGPYLQLNNYPIISITSIKEALDYDFASATALIANSEYRMVSGGKNGILYKLFNIPWYGVTDTVEAKYRGGFCAAGITPGTGEFAMPDDLREAAILQSTLVFKRKDDIGLSSVGAQGGSASKFADMELLPMVKEILKDYIRKTYLCG